MRRWSTCSTSPTPGGDTNPTAHALLERFGDFAGVLEASEEELCEVEGIGPASARLLHLMPQVSGYYHRVRTNDRRRIRNADQMGRYLVGRFRGALEERVLLVSLNKQRQIAAALWLNSGTVDSVQLPVREAVAQAVRMRAHWVILSHNHPGGSVLPSRQDIEATAELARGLYVVGIELLDHIIVAEGEYLSLRSRGEGPLLGKEGLRPLPLQDSSEGNAGKEPEDFRRKDCT